MEAETKEAMAQLYNLLTPVQLDDAESRYDNLQVLLAKVLQEYNPQHEHVPGLDEHIHELTHEVIRLIHVNFQRGQDTTVLLRNCLMQLFWFGYEAGQVQWPLARKKCGEVHA
jgi:hypothetical protein